jgi:hypothetical protein
MDYRYKGHGFNMETKPLLMGKADIIANVHWLAASRIHHVHF